MSLKHLKQIAPTWMNTSKAIFDDKEAHEVMQSLRTQFSMCYAHERLYQQNCLASLPEPALDACLAQHWQSPGYESEAMLNCT